MSETARTDADSVAVDVVPAIGLALSAFALVGTLAPVRRGVDDPLLLTAAGFALAATLAFLGRRHGVLSRRTGASVAGVSSLLVVLLSGYAMGRGFMGTTDVPGLGLSVSLVFVSFLAAGTGVGIAVADLSGISNAGLKRRAVQFLQMLFVGFAGLLSMSLYAIAITSIAHPLLGELTEVQQELLTYLSTGLGLGTVAGLYLLHSERDRSYVDLEVPSLRSVLWVVGGLVVIVVGNYALTVVMTFFGVESADHSTTQQAAENPELLVVMIPAMVLIVGPFEELLYRNVVQKSLYETFSRYGAVVVASVIFAFVHVLAYATASAGRVLISLAIVFGLSLILGTIYERTENLAVPALVHGLYNAFVFASLYAF
ncbi:CPBP family intramembrane glutamic endopeptidase [Natrialbaceae archaeon GCM10025810]|uniref:CPBP family intramembrane glutamic endopeptidase n=1 Tax=Halovalidus salilacus TaxID=3075124 RepID=UPI003617A42E